MGILAENTQIIRLQRAIPTRPATAPCDCSVCERCVHSLVLAASILLAKPVPVMAAVSRSMVVLAVIVCIFAWRWVMMRVNHLPPVTEGYFHPAYRPVAELFRWAIARGVCGGSNGERYEYKSKYTIYITFGTCTDLNCHQIYTML